MRISTATMFEQSIASMNQQQSSFLDMSQKIASGRQVVNPSDDPQAAARAVGVDQSMAVTQQYTDSRVSARNTLSQSESVLNSASDAVTSAKTLLIQASNDTLSDADRQSAASELRGVYETLVGQANATDGNGRYLFGGYEDGSKPFVENANDNMEYVGSTDVRQQRIDASRLMEVSDSGQEIFQSVPSGSGYVAEADPGNQGDLTFKGPETLDTEANNYGKPFEISFAEDGGKMTYSVSADGEPVEDMQGVAYQSGDSLRFGGLSMELKGEPAANDSLTVGPAKTMNTGLFKTLENAIGALEKPAQTSQEQAALSNTLNTSMRELDNSLDNVLTVRASMGARLNELDVVDTVSDNRMLNYEKTLSDLVDLDYTEAISEYSMRQVGMQASQKTFANLQGMSLFQYL